jgi:hypothetical protein
MTLLKLFIASRSAKLSQKWLITRNIFYQKLFFNFEFKLCLLHIQDSKKLNLYLILLPDYNFDQTNKN